MKNNKMLQPIEKDHELICQNCGCVVGQISDYQERSEKLLIDPSVDMLLLGSAIEKNVKDSFKRTPQQIYEERVLRQLIGIIKKYALPERLAIETFKELKKKRRGFQSETIPIKQLLRILSKDDNFHLIHKFRALKEEYKDICDV